MFIPDYRKWNPYQINLSNSLSNLKVLVDFDNKFLIFMNRRYLELDILHIHWPNPFMLSNNKYLTIGKSISFICEVSLLKLFGTKIIWTIHNSLGHEGKFRSIELFFNKLLVKLCDKLIVHCQFAKMELARIYPDKSASIVVIPHGKYNGYDNTISMYEARDKLELNMKDLVFLYIGQIRPYKGILNLIHTFKSLNRSDAKLLIVGKPIDDKIVRDILDSCKDNGNIKTILKFIPDEDIQIYMNAADIVVLPYKDVLTSGTAILSMSFGKPIIAPAIGCVIDILDKNGGFLYSTEDGLLDTMRHVLNSDKKVLIDMGVYNYKLIDQYGWNDIGKKTYNIYHECINR